MKPNELTLELLRLSYYMENISFDEFRELWGYFRRDNR